MREYFYSIPIYNLTEGEYHDKYEKKKRVWVEKFITSENVTLTQQHLDYYNTKNYKPWCYNDIFGWVRFYMVGSQLRGEIFSTSKEMVGNKSNQRILSDEYCPSFIDLRMDDDLSSETILNEINLRLDELQNDKTLFNKKKFYIDLSEFNRISKFIDWESLLNEYSKKNDAPNPTKQKNGLPLVDSPF